MERSSRCPVGQWTPRELAAEPSSTKDGTGHLKGAPVTHTHVTPVPEPDALIALPTDADATKVPDWDLAWDIVDQWGAQSFPASDPPANW
jgi:hypothetical protein